jgi:hypothetical protein
MTTHLTILGVDDVADNDDICSFMAGYPAVLAYITSVTYSQLPCDTEKRLQVTADLCTRLRDVWTEDQLQLLDHMLAIIDEHGVDIANFNFGG